MGIGSANAFSRMSGDRNPTELGMSNGHLSSSRADVADASPSSRRRRVSRTGTSAVGRESTPFGASTVHATTVSAPESSVGARDSAWVPLTKPA